MKGLELFKNLFALARGGDMNECRKLTDEVLSLGWRPSDAAVGLIQPALYQIGRDWEEGRITVAEEHQFSAWCDRALALLEGASAPVPGPLRVLICMVDGNAHTLGPRIAALYLRDRGISVLATVPGLPDAEIIEMCRRENPALLGLSASMRPGLDRARAVVALAAKLPNPPRVVVGGLASRFPEAAGLERMLTVGDLAAALSA
ncbi:MAG: B12-binding domain-containing protein [Elusimicrobiota bacterium]